jgi:DNA-binding response OmpR family regulator
LIVEDEHSLRRAIERAFARRGFCVEAVSTCEEAAAARGPFDVGIFDVHLEDGSGIELAGRMKNEARVKRVLFYSGAVDASERAAAERHGELVLKREGVELLVEAVVG